MRNKTELYYDSLIKKRIGEAIREFSDLDEEKLDPEVFANWVQEAERREQEKRSKRIIRVLRKYFLFWRHLYKRK